MSDADQDLSRTQASVWLTQSRRNVTQVLCDMVYFFECVLRVYKPGIPGIPRLAPARGADHDESPAKVSIRTFLSTQTLIAKPMLQLHPCHDTDLEHRSQAAVAGTDTAQLAVDAQGSLAGTPGKRKVRPFALILTVPAQTSRKRRCADTLMAVVTD